MSALSDFLVGNTIVQATTLPLFHTTRSYHLKSIVGSNRLVATKCTVFRPDKLNYFFVGRPAYKYYSDGAEAEHWELPCCFIFKFASIGHIKRIFPFDSGAFDKGLYPPYISQMPISQFEASAVPDAPARIIGAFFGDARSYFRMRAKDRAPFEAEFSPKVFDAELKALHRLSSEKPSASFDDRRFTIEIQSDHDVDLAIENPLAVIAPMPYFDEPSFRDHVVNVWKATPISYPMHTLSVNQYYASIYERVEEFLKTEMML